ncbi:MAG: radical SAM protein [Deltaproteobacteria bacterium]|nr:radical SAM protein [Deltaproteobacteria bacterium]
MTLLVCETFWSLLGESTRAGLPAFFIRLAGCNLRCRYCDTPYAWEGGEERSVVSLLAAAGARPVRRVLVTGGEPLLQPQVHPLLEGLLAAGCTVLLETNGSLPIAGLDPRVHRIVDVKCPASGMAERCHWENLEALTPRDEVKFVVADREDFRYALEVVRTYQLLGRAPVLISPVFGELDPREAAAWIMESGLNLRLNLQLHKYLWGPAARGV